MALLAAELEARGLMSAVVAIAAAFAVTVDDILGPARTKTVVRARRDVVRLFRAAPHSFSYPEIGRLLGRDHTTIMMLAKTDAERADWSQRRKERRCA